MYSTEGSIILRREKHLVSEAINSEFCSKRFHYVLLCKIRLDPQLLLCTLIIIIIISMYVSKNVCMSVMETKQKRLLIT